MIDQQEPPKMEEIELYKIDQQWLDKRCYSVPADLEPELNRLVDEVEALANFEHYLIDTIKYKRRQLERLPEFIRYLAAKAKQRAISQELAEALEQHDQLAEAHKLLSAKQPAEVEAS